MDSGGRFLIDRNIFESRLWADTVKFRLFFYILGKAAFKDDIIVSGIKLKRGQYLRSYRGLAEDLKYKNGKSFEKYSLATVKRKIDALVKEQRIEIEETLRGTLFTVKNYDKYQCFEGVRSVSQNDYETVVKRLRNGCETIAKQEELNIINANKTAAADARAGEDVPTTSPTAETGEDVPTTSPTAETGEDVPTTSPTAETGEDVPTTSPTAEAAVEKALKLMENLYFKYTGRMVNSMDLVCMQEIAELTADERLIGETMKLTNDKFVPKFSGDKIKSFKYFMFALKEAVEKERVRKNAACAGRIVENISGGKSIKNSGVLGEISAEEFNRRLGGL